MTKWNWISCRDVLWILVFWGFGVNYMLRNNLNLAIVAIVVPRDHSVASSECLQEPTFDHGTDNLVNSSMSRSSTRNMTLGSTTLKSIAADNAARLPTAEQQHRYHWNEYQQGLALGAYYWLHWLLQLPGGLLARKYGTKIVFGLGNFIVAILGFSIPAATHYSLHALVFVRTLQGLIAGVVWPSMHDMTAKWIPPNERSRFVSAYLGSSVGAAITYPLCAFIIDLYGWEAVFHVTSFIGIIWYIFWVCMVYDAPQQHPRITEEEKNHIINSLASSRDDHNSSSSGKKSKKVPWKSILTSGPFWVTISAHWGGVWGFMTFMTQAPSYFNYVQGWNINATGLLSGSPHIARMIFAYIFSVLSDWLLRSKRMTLTGVRKLANFVCVGGQCVLTVALSFSGCEPLYAAFFMIAGTAVNGAVSSGTIPAFVDLSPNYASILFGICNLVTAPAGFLSPLVVGILTNNNQTIGQWRLVFLISAANCALSCIVHLIWGTSTEQSWNNYAKEKNKKDIENALPEGENLITVQVKNIEKTDDENTVQDNIRQQGNKA